MLNNDQAWRDRVLERLHEIADYIITYPDDWSNAAVQAAQRAEGPVYDQQLFYITMWLAPTGTHLKFTCEARLARTLRAIDHVRAGGRVNYGSEREAWASVHEAAEGQFC